MGVYFLIFFAAGYACIGERHAGMFTAYTKQLKNKHQLEDIINQKAKWPSDLKDRDVLYFLAQSFRAKLITELPSTKQQIKSDKLTFVYRAKVMIKELAVINFET